jgi:hypothetical protein
LKRQEYHDKVIKNGFSKASENNRNDLMEYKEKKINKRVPLLLTCHPSLEKISGIVRHHWKEIEKSETLAKLFPEPPVVAFWQPKRITDTLRRIRCFAIDIAKDLILLSCRLAMKNLCVLQLETALATLVTAWLTLADRR